MTTRQRNKNDKPKGVEPCNKAPDTAPKPENPRDTDVQEDSSDSIYGWHYKGPAILGRALEFDLSLIHI